MNITEELRIANNEIDFESKILATAHSISKEELTKEVNLRIDAIKKNELNVEIIERYKKEARVLGLMFLRRYCYRA